MITREDVERNRPGASWASDHMLTVTLVPASIATIIAFPMVWYAMLMSPLFVYFVSGVMVKCNPPI